MPEFKEEIRKRLEGLGLSPAREAEIVEELSQHLEDQYEQTVSRGAEEAEARRAVLAELNEDGLLVPGGLLFIWEPTTGSIFDWLRRIWYRLDKSYFESNERAIDIDKITRGFANEMVLVRSKYGGDFAHLLVGSSLHFRIPVAFLKYYACLLNGVERVLSVFQSRRTACWVLALYRKN